MSIISNTVVIIIGLIFLALSFLLLMDISMASSDPDTYEKVHHMYVSDYIYENVKFIALLIVGFMFSILSFCDEQRAQKWRLATHISGGLFIIYVVIKYYTWYKTGFDH